MTISVEAVATAFGSSRPGRRGRTETRAVVGDRDIDLAPVAADRGQLNHGSGAGGADLGPARLDWDDADGPLLATLSRVHIGPPNLPR